MAIHRIKVERHLETEFFVEGDDLDLVREDAEELAASIPPEQWDAVWSDDIDIDEVPEASYGSITGRDIWSGGPDGYDFQLYQFGDKILRTDER